MATNSAFASQFPEALFRESIIAAMRMGMPESDDEKLIWHWKRAQTFNPDDLAGRPLDWAATAITDDPGNPAGDPEDDGVIVDYVLEASSQVDQSITSIGDIHPQKIKVTVFEHDFYRIRTADYARIGTVVYTIRMSTPPYALFGVTMHDVHLEALDEA